MLNKKNKELGFIAIILSLTIYIRIFVLVFNEAFPGRAGGMDNAIIASILFSIPSMVCLLIQLLIFWSIRKQEKVGIGNLILFLLFYLFLVVHLLSVMPKNLHVINCVFLLGSIIGLYASVLYNKYGLLYLFTCFCLISIGLMFWMKNKTNENESWYVHGKEIRYNDLGKKIYEAEYRKEGIVFGDERVWSDDGTLISFRRYPKGKRHYPDSLVDLQFGKIFKQVYLFDSLNKGYQRIIQYGYFTMNSDSSRYDEQKTELSMVSTIDTLNFNYSTWRWARGRKKRYLYERNYTFDSNGVDYERRILFKEDGTIYNESTQKFDHKRNSFVDYLFGY